MKQVFRLTIILGVSLAGELMGMLIPLPIPGSIYGLILMLLCLAKRIIPLETVHTPGRFLIEIMPVMFIPAAVGLIANWEALKSMLIPTIVITLVSTFVVMGVAGHATQAMMRRHSTSGREEEK